MIGVRLENGRVALCRDLPEPLPDPGEVLVEIRLAGICGTDRAMIAGYAAHSGVLGHEFVGTVGAAPGAPELVGQRVVGRITIACGGCRQCRENRPGHCEMRRVVGIRNAEGVFAERCRLPVSNLVAVPDSVSDEAAVFAEPLAAALRIVEQVRIGESDRVLVIGAGCLGQLVCRVLVRTGCRLEVVARHANQRRLLEAHGILPVPEEETPGRAYDVVVEATGSPLGFAAALGSVRPEGTVVVKSSVAEKIPVDLAAVVVDEITVVGSRCGPLDAAMQWLKGGKIDPIDLIDAAFPVTEPQAAFARASAPGAMKVLLDCRIARP